MAKDDFDPRNLTPDQLDRVRTFLGSQPRGRMQTTEYRTADETLQRKDFGTALDRGAYDYRSTRGAGAADRVAQTQVDVIRAAKQRNPNTPANFDSIAGVRNRSEALAAEMFSKPPTPATLLPTAADFAGGSSPSQFWRNYAAIRTGRPLPREGAPTDSGVRATAGTGIVTQTPYGPIASTTAPAGKPGIPSTANRAAQMKNFLDLAPPSPAATAKSVPEVPPGDAVVPDFEPGGDGLPLPRVSINPTTAAAPAPTGSAVSSAPPQSTAFQVGKMIGGAYRTASDRYVSGFRNVLDSARRAIRRQYNTNIDFARGFFGNPHLNLYPFDVQVTSKGTKWVPFGIGAVTRP